MLYESWYFQLLRLIPESIGMVALGTALIRVKLKIADILIAGVLMGLVGFLLYQLPLVYGMQVPIGLITYILVCTLYIRLNILRSALAAILSFVILIIVEFLYLFVLTRFGFPEEILVTGPDPQMFVAGLPSLLSILAIGLIAQCMAKARE